MVLPLVKPLVSCAQLGSRLWFNGAFPLRDPANAMSKTGYLHVSIARTEANAMPRLAKLAMRLERSFAQVFPSFPLVLEGERGRSDP